MKRNKTFKLGLFLMVLTLMTSCLVGNTFAKYVTTGTGTDTARVAKWGVEVTASGNAFSNVYNTSPSELFAETYSVISTGTTFDENGTILNNGEDVVAPGTSGKLTAISITGTPEVAVRITYDGTVDLGEEWQDGKGNFYCPILITINKGKDNEKIISGFDYANPGAFENDIANALKGYPETYKAGTNLTTTKPPQIEWSWPFEDGAGSIYFQDNAKDTYLGSKSNTPTISLTLKATVTQVD